MQPGVAARKGRAGRKSALARVHTGQPGEGGLKERDQKRRTPVTIQSLKTTLNHIRSYLGTSSREPSPPFQHQPSAGPISGSTYSAHAAHAEGWGVFCRGDREDGSPCFELQACNEGNGSSATFADDVDVWEHVVTRARAGSQLHLAALGIVDPTELRLIRYWCSAKNLAP